MAVATPLIVARGFGWRHAGRKLPTLADIDFTIEAGEKILLLGPSGAGKSTLLAAIAGVLGDDSDGTATGELLIDGQPAATTRGVVGMVLQDPDSQVISARVGDDVAFGAENVGVPREEIWRRVHEALDLVGLRVPLEHPTTQLSGGQKQRLALAGVLAMGARVICLDEPTANIDRDSVPLLRDAVLHAAETTGAALVVVEHRVDAWIHHMDRVIVLDSEGIIADGSPEQVLAQHARSLRDAGVWMPGAPPELPPRVDVPPSAPILLSAEDLAVGYGPRGALAMGGKHSGKSERRRRWRANRDRSAAHADAAHVVASGVNLAIPQAAAVCVIGPNGAGKSTVALTMGGLLRPVSGEVVASPALAGADAPAGYTGHTGPTGYASRIGGTRRTGRTRSIGRAHQGKGKGKGMGTASPHPFEWSSRALAARIGNVFQTPEHQFVTGSVREELELGPKLLGVDASERVDELMERLRLTHLALANPFSLSGGEKRRLSVATVLANAPGLLILDEPTFGQDRTTFTELLVLLRELVTDSGVSVVSVTHDPLVVAAMGDRVIDLAEFAQASGEDSTS